MSFRPIAHVHIWPIAAALWRRRDVLHEVGELSELDGTKPSLQRIRQALDQIDNPLPELLGVRVEEVKPGRATEWTSDDDLTVVRFLLPVVTNPDAITFVGGARTHIPAGNLNWYDHRLPRSTVNGGAYPVVQLLIHIAAPPQKVADAPA
jgi:hypothetical protein